ncbi:MAG: fasciclin domain-containing protein [Bacteroidia bacterium]|nr:fasciclin domain-containing protein [Bacteroidia bacterium]
MKRILRISPVFLLLMLFLTGCVKKEFEDYYARPDNLAPPIYQQLEARGNFKSILTCIDKANYKRTLSNAGYWTFFAPNDAAFQAYFTEKGIGNANDIDSLTAKKIVTYALVYNAFRVDQLSSYQSSTGVIPNQAFKRKTVFYDFVQTESGTSRKIVAANRNGSYVAGDNNNKNIPYFTDAYMSAKGLGASDYNFFFPGTIYSGLNVTDATIINADIAAENGIIHEVDKVVLPLPSIEQYLATNPDYSEFYALLNKRASYVSNADLTHRYYVLSGSADSVYVKLYNISLGFSPNNENYINAGTDAQTGGYTFIAPKNQELLKYTKGLLTKFGTFDAAPLEVLNDFINAHMFTAQVWPSRFTQSSNSQGETPTMSTANVVDAQFLSNGTFYGTNKVQEANVFRTVYSKPYLDPAYTLMIKALNAELKYSIINANVKYTMFMMSNASINAAHYDWSTQRNSWAYSSTAPYTTWDYTTNARDRLYRILQTSVSAPTVDLTSLSGKGIIETYNGEYLRYSHDTVYASGNLDAGNFLVKDSSKTVFNGTVYYMHEYVPATKLSTGGLLTFTENQIGYHLNLLSTKDPNNFGHYYNYLKNSTIYTAAAFSITGTVAGNFYTVFVPNNAAIVQAVKDGLLPGNTTTGVPNFTPTLATDKEKVVRFITYHILNKTALATDGVKNGAFATLLANSNTDPTYISVINLVDNMQLRDAYNNSATVVLSKSNNLSNRTVIHSINKVLKYIY